MNKLQTYIDLLSTKTVYGFCMLGYVVGFLLFGIIMGSGFVAAAITHSALFFNNLEK